MAVEVTVPGLGSRFFPDSMAPEEIKASIDKELNFGAKEPNFFGGAPSNFFSNNSPQSADPSSGAAIALGRAFTDAGQGTKQLALGLGEKLGLVPQGSEDAYRAQTDAETKQYNQGVVPTGSETPFAQTLPAKATELVGQALPYLIPGEGLAAGLGRLGGSLATGALMGATANLPPNESRVAQTVAGGLLGPAAEYGLPLLAAPFTKGINTSLGNFAKPQEQQLFNQFQAAGINPTAADISQAPWIQRLTQFGEKLPLGFVRAKQAQIDSAQNVAQDLLKQQQLQLLKNVEGRGAIMKIQEVAQDPNNKYSAAANKLLDTISSTDDSNIPKIIQNSGNLELLRKKIEAASLFDKANALSPADNVPLTNTLQTLNNAIIEAKKLPISNPKLESNLIDIQDAILNRTNNANPSGINNLNIPKAPGSGLNFKDGNTLNAQIGDMISNYYNNGENAVIGKQGVQYLQQIKNALSDDLDNFATDYKSFEPNAPDFSKAWTDARNYYKNNVVPYQNAQLARALKNDNPDQIYTSFIKQGTRDGAPSLLYNALDNKGKAAVRAGIISDSIDAATNAAGEFSPKIFANQLDSRSGLLGKFFSAKDQAQLQGIQNVMAHISGGTGKLPENGGQLVPLLTKLGITAAFLTHPLALGIAGGLGYGFRKLLTTPAGIKYLLAASSLKIGSPALQSVVNKIAQLSKQAGTQAALKKGGR